MTAVIKDFPVPSGDDLDVTFDIDPIEGIVLTGAQVLWNAYGESFAVPIPSPVLIAKDSNLSGEITVIDSPEQFIVHLTAEDTALEPGNYYYEAEVINEEGVHSTVFQGTMAVTLAVIT